MAYVIKFNWTKINNNNLDIYLMINKSEGVTKFHFRVGADLKWVEKVVFVRRSQFRQLSQTFCHFGNIFQFKQILCFKYIYDTVSVDSIGEKVIYQCSIKNIDGKKLVGQYIFVRVQTAVDFLHWFFSCFDHL